MKVTENIIEIIKSKYSEVGCKKLAEELKLDPKTIYRYAKKFDIPGPTRRFTAIYITNKCQNCEKSFEISKKTISEEHPGKYCSRQCSDKGRRKSNSKLKQCLDLAQQGLTNKQIAKITGYPMGSVASWLNKAKYRREEGKSTTAIRNRFLKDKCCEICGFDRAIEAAHIIATKNGGKYDFNNLLALCPNHHYLFDNNKLTIEEYEMIKVKVESIKNV